MYESPVNYCIVNKEYLSYVNEHEKETQPFATREPFEHFCEAWMRQNKQMNKYINTVHTLFDGLIYKKTWKKTKQKHINIEFGL